MYKTWPVWNGWNTLKSHLTPEVPQFHEVRRFQWHLCCLALEVHWFFDSTGSFRGHTFSDLRRPRLSRVSSAGRFESHGWPYFGALNFWDGLDQAGPRYGVVQSGSKWYSTFATEVLQRQKSLPFVHKERRGLWKILLFDTLCCRNSYRKSSSWWRWRLWKSVLWPIWICWDCWAPPSRIVFELKKFWPQQTWMVRAFAKHTTIHYPSDSSDLQWCCTRASQFAMCRESILSLFAVFEATKQLLWFIRQKTKGLADDTCNLFIKLFAVKVRDSHCKELSGCWGWIMSREYQARLWASNSREVGWSLFQEFEASASWNDLKQVHIFEIVCFKYHFRLRTLHNTTHLNSMSSSGWHRACWSDEELWRRSPHRSSKRPNLHLFAGWGDPKVIRQWTVTTDVEPKVSNLFQSQVGKKDEKGKNIEKLEVYRSVWMCKGKAWTWHEQWYVMRCSAGGANSKTFQGPRAFFSITKSLLDWHGLYIEMSAHCSLNIYIYISICNSCWFVHDFCRFRDFFQLIDVDWFDDLWPVLRLLQWPKLLTVQGPRRMTCVTGQESEVDRLISIHVPHISTICAVHWQFTGSSHNWNFFIYNNLQSCCIMFRRIETCLSCSEHGEVLWGDRGGYPAEPQDIADLIQWVVVGHSMAQPALESKCSLVVGVMVMDGSMSTLSILES